jgi:hypothetical protein
MPGKTGGAAAIDPGNTAKKFRKSSKLPENSGFTGI